MNFETAKHFELAVVRLGAPRKVEESLFALPLGIRTKEVRLSVDRCDSKRGMKYRSTLARRDHVRHVTAFLNAEKYWPVRKALARQALAQNLNR
jgi:hypothetical protein